MNSSNLTWGESLLLDMSQFIRVQWPLILSPFGIVGNILAFWVMSTRQFRGTNNSIYVRVLALSDLTYVLVRGVQLPIMHSFKEEHLDRHNAMQGWFYYTCKQTMFFHWTSDALSRYTLTALTIDRAIVLLMPLRSRTFCTIRTTKISLVVCIIFALSHNWITVITWHDINLHDLWMCPYYFTGYWLPIVEMVKIVQSLANLVLLALGTIGILAALAMSAQQRSKLSNTDEKSKSSHQITVMLLVVVILMLINVVFFTVMRSIDWESPYVKKHWALFNFITSLQLAYEIVNYTINFYIYFTFNQRIRHFVLRKFGCKKAPVKGEGTSVTEVSTVTRK